MRSENWKQFEKLKTATSIKNKSEIELLTISQWEKKGYTASDSDCGRYLMTTGKSRKEVLYLFADEVREMTEEEKKENADLTNSKRKYYSKAQMIATDKYVKENYDVIRFKVRKGTKDRIKLLAEQQGMSVQKFIITVLEKEATSQNFSLDSNHTND